jgi:hypothetical protein
MFKILLLFFFTSISCNAKLEKTQIKNIYMQDIVNVTKDFEKFDFRILNMDLGNYQTEILEDSTYIEYVIMKDKSQITMTPKNSYFKLVKYFYPNGNIKEKGLVINSSNFKKGYWYYFSESGILIKEEDNDLGFTFTFENLLVYLNNEKIPLTKGFIEGGLHTTIEKVTDSNGPKWIIEWYDWSSIPVMLEEIIIDGKNGALIKRRRYVYKSYPSKD